MAEIISMVSQKHHKCQTCGSDKWHVVLDVDQIDRLECAGIVNGRPCGAMFLFGDDDSED